MIRDAQAAVAVAEAVIAQARCSSQPAALEAPKEPARAAVRLATNRDPAPLFIPARRKSSMPAALAVCAIALICAWGILHGVLR